MGPQPFCDVCRHRCKLAALGRTRQGCGPAPAMPGSTSGSSKEAGKSPWRVPAGVPLGQRSCCEPLGYGESQAPANGVPHAGGNSNSHKQHHKLKFSCPNPPFLAAQCYRCSATVVPLIPCLNTVCTVACILLECLCLLTPRLCLLLGPLQPALLSAPQSTAPPPATTSSYVNLLESSSTSLEGPPVP